MRKEKDSIGEVSVPNDAYYGGQTQRAIDNFQISGEKIDSSFIKAQAAIKYAAVIANMKGKGIDKKIGGKIQKVALEIYNGKHLDHFKIDIYQAGAGTSQNMNINEVISNRVLEMMKKPKGSYEIIHPNDHVNMSQSTNDTIHTAIHLSCLILLPELLDNLKHLEKSFRSKYKEFGNVFKSGRTHMQDAVPITLGEEFLGYAGSISSSIERIEKSGNRLKEIPLGGTAIGTGVNTVKNYKKNSIKELSKLTRINFRPAKNIFEMMQNTEAVLDLSSSLKTLSSTLVKISSDLKLLSSGPFTGLNEINLPVLQPGSSIMPGKVNPIMPEMLKMVCFQVTGNDLTITEATHASQLELNVMMPVIAYNIIKSIKILKNAIKTFDDKCVKGITANKEICEKYLEKNPITATALNPYLGYNEVAKIVKESYKTGKTVREIVLEKNLMKKKDLDKVLDYKKLSKG